MAVRWPPGWCALLAPGEAAAEGLELGAPAPCKADGVSYWSLGGPSKARLRVLEDEKKLLQLGESFTVGLVLRAGAGSTPGHDSVLLGHDNKHWLSLEGGKRTLSIVDAGTGKTFPLGHEVSAEAWSVIFLQSRSDGTAVLAFDAEGLVEIGEYGIFLTGSRLRSLGWASNEVQVAQVAVWKRSLPWGELLASLPEEPQAAPPPAPDPPAKPKRQFRGQVVDTYGMGLDEVKVKWQGGDCITDEDGCFEASLSDAETDVPDTASANSAGSADSWLSLSFSREGFAPVAMPAQGAPGEKSSLQVTLRPLSASAPISAETGGSVTDPESGSSVSVPPNGLSYPDGSPVTGEVTVSLSVIDATDPASLASMPGDFTAVGPGGSTVFLQSLGAAWVGAVDEAGRELVVNPDSPGVTVDLKSNATVDAEKLGTVPDMWTFDEASGKWEAAETAMEVDGETVPNPTRPARPEEQETKEELYKKGGKKKAKARGVNYKAQSEQLRGASMSLEDFKKAVAKRSTKSLSARVMKMGYINCDIAYIHPTTAVMMTGKVLGKGGEPVARSQLWSVGMDYGGRCPDITDSNGKFSSMVAQFDSQVCVEVHLREEATDGKKLEVYYEQFPSQAGKALLNDETRRLFDAAPGLHVQSVTKVEGQPAWERVSFMGASKVSWCPQRRYWQHTIDDVPVFVRDEPEEPPAPPFGPGWRLASSFSARLPPTFRVGAPIYERGSYVKKHTAGPFRTGPPGDVTDVGTITCS